MAIRIEAHAEPIPGYRLVSRLGGGGFGEVWRAEAPGGLPKAIKIVHGDLRTLDADGQHRAEQELKAIRRVQAVRHPYLLSLERYDIVDGRLLIVTELADCNLWDRFRQCRDAGLTGIPRADLLRYMLESAEVLDLMSGQYQLQHLDVKPQNIFLIQDHVKVADFGLVKDLEGVRAAVTGGVTPVYASPETFEGELSRFSDQYSLAVCYQELLTGQRPFTGATIHQLVSQHLHAPPNLAPLPPADRAAVAKALSKRPESRFPTCLTFVRALIDGKAAEQPLPPSKAITKPATVEQARQPLGRYAVATQLRHETPSTAVLPRREEPTAVAEVPAVRVAPPEFAGNGALRPAVLVAVGATGWQVARRFRQGLAERFGDPAKLPHLRTLVIDTDPAGVPGELSAGQVVVAKLNRASHYLKPRKGGHSLIDGWLDQQTLYRIPRIPMTQGVRALGRLALADHYAAITAALTAQIEAATKPDALLEADTHTGLGVRTNRPRVVIACGLGGGTGGGMAIDLAYLARARLKYLGYAEPDVAGVLLAPPADRSTAGRSAATGNGFAALLELTYFGRPDTSYRANFGGPGDNPITDAAPPFGRLTVLPQRGPDGDGPDGAALAGDDLVRDLASPAGRLMDERRPAAPAGTVRTFGAASLACPRRALLDEGSRRLCEAALEHWTGKDAAAVRPAVQAWVAEQWAAQKLGPEHLIGRLQAACEAALGQLPEHAFGALAEPFAPRGRRADFDPDAGDRLMSALRDLIGQPDRPPDRATVIDTLLSTAATLKAEWAAKLSAAALGLAERPSFRLAGAEEALAQLRDALDRVAGHYNPLAAELAAKADAAYHRLYAAVVGQTPRRTAAAEFAEAAKVYPKWRYQSLVLRTALGLCDGLRAHLADEAAAVAFCRQRLDELLASVRRRDPATDLSAAAGYLLPPGCATLEDAVVQLLGKVTDADLHAFDDRLQRWLDGSFGGLARLCLTSATLPATLEPALLQHGRQYLADRVGDASVVDLFFHRYADAASGTAAIAARYAAAAPPLAPTASAATELCLLTLPPGPGSDRLGAVAVKALPTPPVVAASLDDIAVVREQPAVPLALLPPLGPRARDAYRQLAGLDHFTPHSRLDVPAWE